MRMLLTRRMVAIMLLAMASVNSWVLWKSRENWLQGYCDFTAFYTAGTLLDRGQSAKLYDRAAEWKVQQEFASQVTIRHSPLPYIRPPFEALLFAAFALWRFPVALGLWTAFKCFLLLLIPLIVVPRRDWHHWYPPWLVAVMSFGTFPVFMDIVLGQDSILLAFLFAVTFRLLASGRDLAAGLILGLGLTKFHLVAPFGLMTFLAGRKRLGAGFVFSAAVEVIASAALMGWRGLAQYPRFLASLSAVPGVGVMSPDSHINLRGLLTMIFFGRSPTPAYMNLPISLAAVAAIVYVGGLWRRAGRDRLAEAFALALIAALVTSYYTYRYDLTLLLVPMLAIQRQSRVPSRDFASRLEFAGVMLLLFTPLYWLLKFRLQSEYLIVVPLLAVGVALAWRLRQRAGASVSTLQHSTAQ